MIYSVDATPYTKFEEVSESSNEKSQKTSNEYVNPSKFLISL